MPKTRARLRFIELPPSRHGGGRVIKALGADGHLYAIKTAVPLDSPAACDVPASLSQALREEYVALTAVSGIKGFAKAYGYGTVYGVPAILMEWVCGHSLAEVHRIFLEDPPPTDLLRNAVTSLGCALCDILLNARRIQPGFLHRDISSNNVIVHAGAGTPPLAQQLADRAFNLCIVDLGSAQDARNRSTFTMRTGTWRFGTPEFAPPEMLSSDIRELAALRTSPSIDVYEVCSLLYTLYSGRTPYRLDEVGAPSPYLYKLEHDPAPLIPHAKADKPLVQALMAGIKIRQSERIGLAELRSALGQIS